MALLDSQTFASGPTSIAGRTRGFLTNLMTTLVTWNDKRVTRKTLNALSDRELSDIGLSRADIDGSLSG